MDTVLSLPRAPLTVEDLDALRDAIPADQDGGHRYELIDGVLIVTPSPALRHQWVQSNLGRLLLDACPADLFVLFAPMDVVLATDTVAQPDILVVRREGTEGAKVRTLPVLAVEFLSASTRLVDLNLKRARFEQAGIPSYWVVDPQELWLRAWELRERAYVETAFVSGDEQWTAEAPYAVTIAPGRLAD